MIEKLSSGESHLYKSKPIKMVFLCKMTETWLLLLYLNLKLDKIWTPLQKLSKYRFFVLFSWLIIRTNTQKRCPFHYRGLECKSRKSRNNWGNRQIWPWNTEWSRAKANRVLPRKCTGHSKHPLPTTQEKTLHMDITRWSTSKSHWYSLQPKMEKLYTVSKNKTRSWLWLRSWTPYCQIQT